MPRNAAKKESSLLLGERLPRRDEREVARQLRDIITAFGEKGLMISDPRNTQQISLMPSIAQLLTEVLGHVSAGEAVTLIPVSEQLTTQRAADLLNVSRPHLVKLLENGEIPYTMVGRHRRIGARDLFRFKRKRDADRAAALEDIASVDAELL